MVYTELDVSKTTCMEIGRILRTRRDRLGVSAAISLILQTFRKKILYEAPLSGFSAVERLRWASERTKPHRAEDMAYCLLGIFNICMLPIYGEGEAKALFLLKDEIGKSYQWHSEGIRPEAFPQAPFDLRSMGLNLSAPTEQDCGCLPSKQHKAQSLGPLWKLKMKLSNLLRKDARHSTYVFATVRRNLQG